MKKITKEQIDAILQLLQKYNVGVQEFSAVSKMLNELPEVKCEKKVEKK